MAASELRKWANLVEAAGANSRSQKYHNIAMAYYRALKNNAEEDNDPEWSRGYKAMFDENGPAILDVATAFLNGGIKAGHAAYSQIGTYLQDQLSSRWDDEGLNIEKDVVRYSGR